MIGGCPGGPFIMGIGGPIIGGPIIAGPIMGGPIIGGPIIGGPTGSSITGCGAPGGPPGAAMYMGRGIIVMVEAELSTSVEGDGPHLDCSNWKCNNESVINVKHIIRNTSE